MSLPDELITVPLVGGIDTKTDPRLVQPGAFLELENVFRQRTGELVKRFGSASIGTTGSIVTGGVILGKLRGALLQIKQAVTTAFPGGLLWDYQPSIPGSHWSFPVGNFRGGTITPVISQGQPSSQDSTDPDAAASGNYNVIGNQFVDPFFGNRVTYTVFESASGLPVGPPVVSATSERIRCAGVAGFLCVFCVDTGANSLVAKVFSTATNATATFTVAAGVLPAANRFYDVRPRDGAATIVIAYRVAAGGVSFVEFNPATGALTTGPVNIAGVDANQCLGWIEDRFSTGAYYLASAGTTSGVVVRTLSAAFAATATNTMDATATTGVRNVTGFLTSADGQMKVFWEVSAPNTYDYLVRLATWTGASVVSVFRRSVGLASKAFQYRNGYYLLLAYESPTQPTFFVSFAEPSTLSGADDEVSIQYGAAGGHTVNASALCAVNVTGAVAKLAISTRVKVTAANGSFSQVRNSVTLSLMFDEIAVGAPRELGGSTFIPGGVLKIFDGQIFVEARPPLAPETPTVAIAGAGNLTAGVVYQWVALYKYLDATGRIYRTSPSPVSAKLTSGGAFSASVTIPTLRVGNRGTALGSSFPTVELYRLQGNGTTFYRVAEAVNSQTADTLTIADNVDDVTLGGNEVLYTTAGVLDDFDAPAFTAIEIFGGRLWGISSEDRTRIYYSKELLPGLGVAFRPDAFVRMDQADGDAFALSVLNDRLVIFKRSAIYALSGAGPNALGQGGYGTPTLITNAGGNANPRAVVIVPDGVMFEAQRGIWQLGRSGDLTYIGAPVDAYFTGGGQDISAAVHMPWRTQVRFFTVGGRTLVYDYQQRQWSTFTGQPASSAVTIGTTLYWVHPTTDIVSQETEGAYGDAGVGYAQKVTVPHLAFAGIAGFQRVRAAELLGAAIGVHTVQMDVELNYSGATAFTKTLASAAAWPRGEMRFDVQRCSAAKITISESAPNVNAGFALSGLSLRVAVLPGLARLPAANRFT